MHKKLFISSILLILLILSIFSYYFYNVNSLKSKDPEKTFDPKSFSEEILHQTLILSPNSLMYGFIKQVCSTTENGNQNVNIDLSFNNTQYSKINFRYYTVVLGNFLKLIDNYYVSESLQDFKDSILYKQHFSFSPDDDYTVIEMIKKDNSFIVNGKKTFTTKETCEFFNSEYNETLSKITNLNANEKKEIITIEDQNFKTSYVKYGIDVDTFNKADEDMFYNENWTAIEKELNGFSIKSIKHTNDRSTMTQIIYYKFDKIH